MNRIAASGVIHADFPPHPTCLLEEMESGTVSRIRKDGPPKVRKNVYLENAHLLAKMCGKLNHSWFLDELIAREHRRREKKATQSHNKSSLTA